VKTSDVNTRDKRENKAVCYPLASTVEDMRPSTCLTAYTDALQEACNMAFATTCYYSGARDLVEEMVAAGL
jgi:hypothetical protein